MVNGWAKGWYRDRADGIWTIDLDPDYDGKIDIQWTGYFPAPVGVVTVGAIVVEGAGAAPVVSLVSSDDNGCRLSVKGSGAKVTLQVAHALAARDDLTIRCRPLAS